MTLHRVAKKPARSAGFTLLELLIVLAILGLLAWLATPPVLRYLETGRLTTTRAQIQNLSQALGFYANDVGQYPTTEEGLVALLTAPPNMPKWNGPYVKGQLPHDGWGHEYQYKFPGEHGEYDIRSAGSDGNLGTSDDMGNWTN